jgi:hypothetical protein
VEATVTPVGNTGMTTVLRMLRKADLPVEVQMRPVFMDAGGAGKGSIPEPVRGGSASRRSAEAA